MDLPDLGAALKSAYRILKAGGRAAAVFSHPCFPQGQSDSPDSGRTISYRWDFSYFEERRCTDPPWKHFRDRFVRFHRPLSVYWESFVRAGFQILEFAEPHITAERRTLAENERQLRNSLMRPYSTAFLLRKPLP